MTLILAAEPGEVSLNSPKRPTMTSAVKAITTRLAWTPDGGLNVSQSQNSHVLNCLLPIPTMSLLRQPGPLRHGTQALAGP